MLKHSRLVWITLLFILAAVSSNVSAQEHATAEAPAALATRARTGQDSSRCTKFEELEPATGITFVVVALFGGLICYHLLARVPLPYTAMLLAFGVVLGVANEAGAHWDKLAQGICLWENINPVLLLGAFLPILLFGSAFSAHWHTARRQLPGILLLAFPGVLLGTAAIAVLTKYTFPYNWSWVEALLFGAMMAATDPVATVAVLGKCGASEQLKMLIEGESLLNDGSASAVFFLMQAWVEGQRQSGGKAIRVAVQLSLGGTAFGVVVGMVATLWLGIMFNNQLGEITLTLVAAYGAYTVSDELLNVSGLLALVACGTWLAAKGRHRISSNVEPPMRTIWNVLEYLANTLIFVLAGVIIAGRIWNSEHEANSLIQPADYGYAVLLWVYLQVVRAVSVLVLWPLLTRLGYGLTWREGIVLIWAGLRGAVGLSLALFVLFNNDIEDLRYRTLSFFFMGLMAIFTLLAQGTTTGPLLQVLGLTKPPKERRHFLEQVFKDMDKDLEPLLNKAHDEDHPLGEPNWVQVKHHTQLDSESLLQRYGSMLNASFLELTRSQTGQAISPLGPNPAKRQSVLTVDRRRRLLLSARASLLDVHFFEKNSDVFHVLSATDRALDHTNKPLRHWELLKQSFHFSSREAAFFRMAAGNTWLAPLAQRLLAGRLQSWLLQTSAFVFIQEDAAKELYRYEALEDSLLHDQEMGQAGQGRIQGLLSQEVARTKATRCVLQESKREVEAANSFLANVRAAFPEVAQVVRTSQLSHAVLAQKNRFVEHLTYTGLVEELESSEMEQLLERRKKGLYFWGPRAYLPPPSDMARHHPVMTLLSDTAYATAMRKSVYRISNPGDTIAQISRGAPLLLLRGKLEPLTAVNGSYDSWPTTEKSTVSNLLTTSRTKLGRSFANGALELEQPSAAGTPTASGSEVDAADSALSDADDIRYSPSSGSITAPALLGVQSLLLDPSGAQSATARLRFVATTITITVQLRQDAFEANLQQQPQAAHAAKAAAVAQQLLMWGGPLVAERPLAQLVRIAQRSTHHHLPAGTHLPQSTGPWFVAWGCVSARIHHADETVNVVNGSAADIAGDSEGYVAPCILPAASNLIAVTAALAVALPAVDTWPPASEVPRQQPDIQKLNVAPRGLRRGTPQRAGGLKALTRLRREP